MAAAAPWRALPGGAASPFAEVEIPSGLRGAIGGVGLPASPLQRITTHSLTAASG